MNLGSRRIESRLWIRRARAARGTSALLYLFAVLIAGAAAQPGAEASQSPYRLKATFNPTLAIIIVVLICAFFFMGYFSFYVRQCTEGHSPSSRSPAAADGNSTSLPSARAGGLDRAVIASLPTFLYAAVKDLKMSSPLECAVCLSEFEDGDALRLLPRCDHAFHPECIDAWFASRTTCPVCRTDVSPPDAGKLAAESNHSPPPPQTLENPDANIAEPHSRAQAAIIIDSRGASEEGRSSRAAVKFPRSHSTGHSLSYAACRPREEWERYTLSLPEEVRMSTRELQKGDVDPWVLSMAPPFLSRVGSVRLPVVTDVAWWR